MSQQRAYLTEGAPTQARARFIAALAQAAVGAAVGLGAFTFTPGTERWVGFGAGAALVVVIMAAFAVRGRGTVQRLLDLPTVLTCVWLVVCTRAVESSGAGSSPHAIKWLNLSAAAMLCGAGLFGLLLHEWTVERDLRRSAVRLTPVPPQDRPARAHNGSASSECELTFDNRYAGALPRSAR